MIEALTSVIIIFALTSLGWALRDLPRIWSILNEKAKGLLCLCLILSGLGLICALTALLLS